VTEHKVLQRFLLEFIGSDTLVATVSFKTGRDYKDAIKQKTTQSNKPLSDARVNMYIGYASAVFNFAKRHNHIKDNPFEGLQIRGKKVRADKLREIFTTEDLKLMFVSSKEYGSRDMCQHPHNFWIPLLALFTGCRLEEIAQLRVSDIRQYEKTGIWYLDINQDQARKSVKTSDERQVPLHSFIINDLNFLSYVNSLSKDSRVFPKLKYINNRWGHNLGRWFSSFKTRAGIVAEKNKKVFHSFRHNVSTNLKYNRVPTDMIDEVTGHAGQGEQSRYGKPYTVEQLYTEAILKLDYKINLDHLKKSKYVTS